MVWLSKIVQNLFTVLVTDATWMICCHVSLTTGCTNDTVVQGYLFSSKLCHESFASSHPLLYGFESRQFLQGDHEEQHLLHVLRQHHRTHYPKTIQAPGCHPPALIRLLLQLQKLLDFFCLSSLKCANSPSPRCTQYRFGYYHPPATLVFMSFPARGNKMPFF